MYSFGLPKDMLSTFKKVKYSIFCLNFIDMGDLLNQLEWVGVTGFTL